MKNFILFILFVSFQFSGVAQTATITSTNVNCSGLSNGSIIIINASGGGGTYEYSIDGGATWPPSGVFNGIAAGIYDIRIRDAANILNETILDGAYPITEPAILSGTIAGINELACNGGNSGSININASAGGSNNYEYTIDGASSWQSSSSFPNLSAASYNIKIRDALATNCVITLNAALVLTQPAALSATPTKTDIACFGAANGIINVTLPTGGGGTYDYSINGGSTWQASNTFASLAPGMYNVKIRDAVNTTCTATVNGAYIISQNAVLAGTVTPTNVSQCFGNSNGSIVVSAPTGGGGTYQYSNNGGTTWQASGTFPALAAGSYNVKIRDAATTTCEITLNSAINITQPVMLSAAVASTNVTYNGANDGTITISGAAGGSGSFDYTINGGTAWLGSGVFATLANATYDVRIRDAANTTCFNSLNAALVISQPAVLSATVTPVNISVCNGNNNGSITMSGAAGGSGNYQYSISTIPLWQVSPVFSNLAAGSYNVMIRDANATASMVTLNAALVLTQPAALSATPTKTDIACFGAANGAINVTLPTGGGGTYDYSINGGSTWQVSNTFASLTPGMYNVKIRDAVNTTCTATVNGAYIISQNAVLTGTVTPTNVSQCFGNSNGSIVVSAPTGGGGTYQYSNNGGTTWQASGTFPALTAGSYNVRIRDAVTTTCEITLNAVQVITQPVMLSAAVASTNVTYNGANDGTITISGAAGGGGTYGYSINGGTAWLGSGVFTALTNATYNVQIRDAVNTACVITLNAALVISQPAVLSSTINSVNISVCNGNNNGSITMSGAAGGSGNYQYSISTIPLWQVSPVFSNLAAGSYNVMIRDANATASMVTLNAALVLTQPAALSATPTKTDIACFGAANGAINVTLPTGGAGTYDYSINGGSTWQVSNTFASLTPGMYNVKIRDAVNTTCTATVNGAYIISQNAVLTGTVTPTNVSQCFGNSNGSIVVSAPTGGGGTYQYSNNGGTSWQVSGTFPALTAGSYIVRIRDAVTTTCEITLNAVQVITQPVMLSAAVASTNVTYNGANDGTITISGAAGGGGTYGYSINGGTSWLGSGVFTALTNATYNVQIRDAVNTACVITLNAALVISQPAVLSATVNSVNISVCNGNNNGSITMSGAAGGSGNYQYSISTIPLWQVSPVFSNLVAGSYNVMIRDANATASMVTLNAALVLTQPAALSATPTKTDIACFGAANGIINVTLPTGGGGTYDYSINGGSTWQTSNTFASLTPGMYNVKIRDAVNTTCTATVNGAYIISQNAVLAGTVTPTNVSQCFGNSNGSIVVSAPTGGGGTYQYSNNGGTTWQASGTFPALTAGSYNVRIRDAVNTTCEITLNSAINITQPVILSASVASTNVTYNGANDGTITISGAAGGSGSFDYTINGGTAWQGSGVFATLANATYDVRIRDAANTTCFNSLNAALVISQPTVLSATINSVNISVCNGNNNGSITMSGAAGGSGNYQYSISTIPLWQVSPVFSNLVAGSYNVMIRDANATASMVTLNAALVLTQPAALSATPTKTDIACFGAANGIINVTLPTGGGGTYDYSINGGSTWQASNTFASLTPGMYNVKIRDAVNTTCTATVNGAYIISQNAVLAGTVTPTNVSQCFGNSNGSIVVSAPTGGGGTYQYSNNGGTTWQASGTFPALTAGSYNVRIRDAVTTTCEITLNAVQVITQPVMLSAAVASTNTTCNGISDGSITITAVNGGGGTYQYTVNGGTSWQASGLFSGLTNATYDVKIRDAGNTTCIITLNSALAIAQPVILSATVTPVNISICNGNNNGTITMSAASGGSGSYQYSINGGTSWQVSPNFINLFSAPYNVQIRDENATACTITLNPALTLNQPVILSATLAKTNINCYNASNGSINISLPLGGGGTYEYSINGGTIWQVSSTFAGLAAGTYNVKMRDAANTSCTLNLHNFYQLTQPNILAGTITHNNISQCFGNNNGSIAITAVAGGAGTYNYSINGGTSWQFSNNFLSLIAGNYDVRIRDAAATACVITLNATQAITQPSILSASTAITNTTCNGTSDGTITITAANGGGGTYQYTVNGGTSWQATGLFTGLTNATYDVKIRDAGNTTCIITLNSALAIAQPVILSATVSPVNISVCNGNNNGTITMSAAAGGSGSYQYSINGGTSWQVSPSFINLFSAPYNVQIRDGNATACTITLNPALTLNQPAILSATAGKTDVNCNNSSNGIINITFPTGGAGTYDYSINGGTTWQASGTFPGLAAGIYNLKMRDAANITCITTLNNFYAVNQPNILSGTISPTNVSQCFGNNNGSIAITGISGGGGTYQYSNNGGTTWQFSNNFLNLVAGIYNIRIRDAAVPACTITLNATQTISQPVILSGSVASSNVTCTGFNNGTINISNSNGGSGAFQYSNNGGVSWQGSSSFNSLTPNVYSVNIRDLNNSACIISLNPAITITQPAFLDVNFTIVPNTYNITDTNAVHLTATPSGGMFTGPGVITYANSFYPNLANLGSNYIQYRYIDTINCSHTVQDTVIIVTSLGSISGLASVYCYDALTDTIIGHSAPDTTIIGTFYGRGIVQVAGTNKAVFYPNIAGQGKDTILFIYNYLGVDLEVSNFTFVDSVAIPDFNYSKPAYCYKDSMVTLTPSNLIPTGGTGIWSGSFSGDSINNSVSFNPSNPPGNYSITYTYTSQKNCVNSITKSTIIHPLPVDSFIISNSLCINTAPLTIMGVNATLSNISFIVNLINTTNNDTLILNPAALNLGANSIRYNFTNSVTGCSDFRIKSVIINPLPSLTFNNLPISYCSNGAIVAISGKGNNITQGNFDGDGIIPGTANSGMAGFNPSIVPVGNHPIYFTYTDANNCADTISQIITVHDTTLTSITIPSHTYCQNDSQLILTGTPTTGTFSINNVTGANFNPSVFSGNVDIKYTFTDIHTCLSTLNDSIFVKSLPVDTITAQDKYCNYNTVIPITGGNAFYKGLSFIININTTINNDTLLLNPSMLNIGTNSITYNFTDTTTGCSNKTNKSVTINQLPPLSILDLSPAYCLNAITDTIHGTGWGIFGNNFSGSGIDTTNGVVSFSPAVAGVGPDTIRFSFTDANTCFATTSKIITVHDTVDTYFSGFTQNNWYCFEDSIHSVSGNPIINGTGNIYLNELPIGTSFNPLQYAYGANYIKYVYVETSTTCKSILLDTIYIQPLPVDSFYAPDKICKNANPILIHGINQNVISNSFTYNSISQNIDTISFNPSTIPIGPMEITYQFADPITSCSNKWKKSIIINQVPTLNIIGNGSKYCINNSIDTLKGEYSYGDNINFSGGTFSGIGITSAGNGTGFIDPSAIPSNLFSNSTRQYTDTIHLNFTDINGCASNKSVPTIIYGLPDLNIIGINTLHSFCRNDAQTILTEGINPPQLQGGNATFKINGIQTAILSPAGYDNILNSTTQSYIKIPIKLSYVAPTSQCVTEKLDTVVIHKLPDVDFAITSDKCIASTVQFEGISVMDSISTWMWHLGDGTIIANDSAPSHNYSSGGNKTIVLEVTSKFGCINSKDSIIHFDSIPKAQFIWKNECFGSSVRFINQSVGDSISHYSWNFGDNNSSILKNPTHPFADTGFYSITLIVTTQNSCKDTISQIAQIRPEVKIYPYIENFATSSGAWSSGSNNNKNSWRFGQALGNKLPLPYSGPNAWYTSYKQDTAYQRKETSFVISPCFNFSSLKRPMIKMKIYCSLEKNYNGAALQYSLDNDSTWITLKDGNIEEDGINWYGKTVNNSHPGGGNYGWSDTLNKQWIDARHDLDNLAGKQNVRFRIAFATNDLNSQNGFAFDDIWIGEKPRKVLYEHFTNANVSGGWNTVFNTWVSDDKRDVIDIQYHTSFPASDKLNRDNPNDPNARSFLYGVSQTPYSIMDGNYFYKLTSDWSNPLDFYRTKFIKRRLTDPKFKITLSKTLTSSSVNIIANIEANDSLIGRNVTVHIAVVEKLINRTDVGTNGETKFRSVLKKMLPNAGGTNISQNWFPASNTTINATCPLSGIYNSNDSNIVVIAFVQDDATKEIYQAATSDTSTGSSIWVTPMTTSESPDFIIFPNPSDGNFNIQFNYPTAENTSVQIFNCIGQQVMNKEIKTGSFGDQLGIAESYSGIYFVRIIENNKVIGSKKITINR